VPKPNFGFAKRQRELAKKQKKEEKRLRKSGGDDGSGRPQEETSAPRTTHVKPA
jgi:hypothetical protein